MKNLKTAIVILLSSVTLTSFAAKPPVAKTTGAKVPSEVQAITARITQCAYWNNEDVWVSKARSDEIRANIKKLNCRELGADEMAVRKKYQNNRALVEVIEEAKSKSAVK